MFFNSWQAILRIVIVGVLSYIGLVVLLRISGKRTLSKLNAFDLVVTVALGSTLATILLSKQTALADGITAFLILIGMQFIVAWLSVRSQLANRVVKSEPRMLLYNGKLLKQAMQKERVTEIEMKQVVRSSGYTSFNQLLAVILETDGSFTVVNKGTYRNLSAFNDVKR